MADRGGLVVGHPTAVRENPGSNLTAASRVYHDSHCDIHPWAWVVQGRSAIPCRDGTLRSPDKYSPIVFIYL